MLPNWLGRVWFRCYGGYNMNKDFKIGVTAFLITACILGMIGGLIAVNEVSYQLSEGERKTTTEEKVASESKVLSYLPPQCQVFLTISRWQTEWWDYYFTVIKAP